MTAPFICSSLVALFSNPICHLVFVQVYALLGAIRPAMSSRN